MTGLDFLTAAASEGELPCAFILVTGQGSEAVAVEAMKRGVRDYLIKEHINVSSLWRAITTAVTETELRHSLAKSHRELTHANIALAAAKEAAESADRAKTQFVAMVTHELRTPLNGILGYAQLLQAEGGLTERQALHVHEMTRAGQYLLEMIQNVLDFASIETGRIELHPTGVIVRELVETCLSLVQPQADARGLMLVSVVSASACGRLTADPSRLREVIVNLLANAVKYTEAGRVELRVLPGKRAGTLRIEVADTGPGIDQALRHRLFHEFERLTTSASIKGAGLGLAIAARIVKMMGGEIDYSDNQGGGSVFWLELPINSDQSPLLKPAAGITSRACWRILVVDDVDMNRDVISGLLHASGHNVMTANDGQEALKLAAERTFDLILMDVRMPVMDGLEATRQIRSLPPPYGHVPILALTAYTIPEQITQCVAAGMDGHLTKPVDHATLLSVVDETIRSSLQPHSALPTASASIDCEAKASSPALDRQLFDTAIGLFAAEEVPTTFASLRRRLEQISYLLDQSGDCAELADAVHGLASVAGTFGFGEVFLSARKLECSFLTEHSYPQELRSELRWAADRAVVALSEVELEYALLV